MADLRFEWDKIKAANNQRKHHISFEEGATAFYDEYAIEFDDPDHSLEEDRFILFGLSRKLRVVVVCHCFREPKDTIRIISVRKADKQESLSYFMRRSK
jgi:uncharacterized DUF497 family protein